MFRLGIKQDGKKSAKIEGLKPEMVLGLMILERLWGVLGFDSDLVVTSGVDGKHSPNSLHYKGRALDIRTRDLTPEQKSLLTAELKKCAGDEYDIVLEETHLHFEFDPK